MIRAMVFMGDLMSGANFWQGNFTARLWDGIPIAMKAILFLLAVSIIPAAAKLPQMSEKTDWLGYFVGWEGRNSDFGIGADAESSICPRKSGKRHATKKVMIHYLIEEKMKGRWVRRKFLEEGGLESKNEKGLNPKGPVVVTTTVTGGTKVEWTNVVARGKVSIKPKILGKKTENEVRVGVEFALPRLYRFDEKPEERELKKKVGKDFVKATRLKDRKSVKVKFNEEDEKLDSEDNLAEGASEVEMQSKAFLDLSFMVENGGTKVGRIDIQQKGPLYNSFRMTWMADPEKVGEKDCYVTAWVE